MCFQKSSGSTEGRELYESGSTVSAAEMFCTSVAKEEGAFDLASVFRWSFGDGFPLFFF
jgi:hypothetical protein